MPVFRQIRSPCVGISYQLPPSCAAWQVGIRAVVVTLTGCGDSDWLGGGDIDWY